MTDSPLFHYSQLLINHLPQGLDLGIHALFLAVTALAFLFHRVHWFLLLVIGWVLFGLAPGATSQVPAWSSAILWLGWLSAQWRPDHALRQPAIWLPGLALIIAAAAHSLPLPSAVFMHGLPGLTPLAGVGLPGITLCLSFLALLSILFRYFLAPGASWPWQLVGWALTVWLSLQPTGAPLVWAGWVAALGALLVTDAYSVAYRDALTGIPNRRALTQMQRTLGRHYAIAMGDVDHFKSFNDTWGHETGDQVLKLVARVLSQHRLPVKVFRYGGEEFTLVFRGMTAEQATPVLETLRERVAGYPLTVRKPGRPASGRKGKRQRGQPSPAKQVNITLSFGVTDATKGDASPDAALQRADKALYKAKQAGRNCVRSN
ncbi:GGDEF domain-containing protein [Saccharospirillum impatiens]|uniref:GGDEF domain-containing protein n=1 Tax=Saccharospirillum impatiens TaxID=169438 RepID=UPI00041B1977|nr:GGDEF domain-containing protein [Saccharospirillum impatiens]